MANVRQVGRTIGRGLGSLGNRMREEWGVIKGMYPPHVWKGAFRSGIGFGVLYWASDSLAKQFGVDLDPSSVSQSIGPYLGLVANAGLGATLGAMSDYVGTAVLDLGESLIVNPIFGVLSREGYSLRLLQEDAQRNFRRDFGPEGREVLREGSLRSAAGGFLLGAGMGVPEINFPFIDFPIIDAFTNPPHELNTITPELPRNLDALIQGAVVGGLSDLTPPVVYYAGKTMAAGSAGFSGVLRAVSYGTGETLGFISGMMTSSGRNMEVEGDMRDVLQGVGDRLEEAWEDACVAFTTRVETGRPPAYGRGEQGTLRSVPEPGRTRPEEPTRITGASSTHRSAPQPENRSQRRMQGAYPSRPPAQSEATGQGLGNLGRVLSRYAMANRVPSLFGGDLGRDDLVLLNQYLLPVINVAEQADFDDQTINRLIAYQTLLIAKGRTNDYTQVGGYDSGQLGRLIGSLESYGRDAIEMGPDALLAGKSE